MTLTKQELNALRAEPIDESIGNRLQRAIDIAGETQTGVAKALGLSYTYVSDTARGRHQTITVDNAHKFAGHFGCAIEDLFPCRMEAA